MTSEVRGTKAATDVRKLHASECAPTSAIAKAVGDGVVVTGGRSIQVSQGEVIAQDVPVDTVPTRVISSDKAFDRIGAAVRLNLKEISGNLRQVRDQSRRFFNLTLVLGGLGFVVILFGVVLLLLGQTTAGIVSAVASIVPEVTAALFFQKDRELRGTIERQHADLVELQRLLTMVDVAETIGNSEERDSIKQAIIFQVLGIGPSPQVSSLQPEDGD